MVRSIFTIGFLVALASQRSFVGTAPTINTNSRISEEEEDDTVKELENLKHSLGRTLSMMRTQTSLQTDADGEKEIHSTETEEEETINCSMENVLDTAEPCMLRGEVRASMNNNLFCRMKHDGKLVAKLFQQMDTDPEASDKEGQPSTRVQTEVEVPSEGIHKTVVQQLPADYPGLTENGNRKSFKPELPHESPNSVESSNSLPILARQYTPLDMAEYVFWTGDEKSISQVIEEFLQEGLMNREEAILFLQEIKYNLDYLKSHYTPYGLNSREQHSTTVNGKQHQQENYQITLKPELPHEVTVGDQIRSELNQLRQLQEAYKKRNVEREASSLYFPGSNHGKTPALERKNSENEDYEELLNRLRLADFLYTEYSLEEVIYQLAKVMFTQSLTGGNAEAQRALTKFTTFLENEAEQGHISRALEKKVLDVLIASLADTVNEHPELLDMKQSISQTSENMAGQHLLRQILELPPEDKAFLQRVLNPNNDKEKEDRSNLLNHNSQIKEEKMRTHVPFVSAK